MFAALLFIVVLGVLVLVHEWGHFYAARLFGIRVDEFGFGFPPKLIGKKIGETLYSLNLFPLGGFVRIYGEQGEGESDPASFISHPIWQRFMVIVAGVIMNVILAWFLFTVGHLVGIPSVSGDGILVSDAKVTIIGVSPGSPAEEAKLSFGNVVLSLKSGSNIIYPKTSTELINFVNAHRGEKLVLEVEPSATDKEIKIIEVETRASPPPGQGAIGIALADVGIYHAPWYLAPWEGLKSLWLTLKMTFDALIGLFRSAVTEGKIPEGVSGPLGLFVLTGQVERLWFSYFIMFIASLSVNLALLNAVPFPALDGGRILFLVIEKIRGKAVHINYERATHAVGFVLLIALILLISYHDLNRFIF